MTGGNRTVDGVAAGLALIAGALTLAKVALFMTLLAATTSFIIGFIRIFQWVKYGGRIDD